MSWMLILVLVVIGIGTLMGMTHRPFSEVLLPFGQGSDAVSDQRNASVSGQRLSQNRVHR